ncbi:MAG TPA: ABC transporter permease [Planctomycetota bacterium]|nr:ABC transporter permease [Planctomycetota bacterium]
MLSRIWSLTKIELFKFYRQRIFFISLVLVALVVALSVLMEKISPSGKGPVNGIGPLIAGCLNGFRLVTFLILVIGALLVASETTFGTIRTILIAPIRRSELVLAKAITVIILALFFTLLIEAIAFGLSWFVYGFHDITDPTFPEIVHLARSEMLLYVLYTFLHILLPLAAIGLMGLFISTLVENAGISVAISIILYLVLDSFVANLFEETSSFLFNPYWNYYLDTLKNMSEGALQEIWRFKAINSFLGVQSGEEVMLDAGRNLSVIKSFVIPVIYSIIFVILSILAVHPVRKSY